MLISICGQVSNVVIQDVANLLGYDYHPNQNQYTREFNHDHKHWAFHLLVDELKKERYYYNTIVNKNIHETVLVQSSAMRDVGLISPQEHKTILYLYKKLKPNWPDLIVIIDIPTNLTISRLTQEQNITDYGEEMKYVTSVHKKYIEWVVPTRSVIVKHHEIDRRTVEDPIMALADIIRKNIKVRKGRKK